MMVEFHLAVNSCWYWAMNLVVLQPMILATLGFKWKCLDSILLGILYHIVKIPSIPFSSFPRAITSTQLALAEFCYNQLFPLIHCILTPLPEFGKLCLWDFVFRSKLC